MGWTRLDWLIIILAVTGFILVMTGCRGDDFLGQYNFTQKTLLDTCSSAQVDKEVEKKWIISDVDNDTNYFLHGHPQAEYVLTSYDGAKTFAASYLTTSPISTSLWEYLATLEFKNDKMIGHLVEDTNFNGNICSMMYSIKGERQLEEN